MRIPLRRRLFEMLLYALPVFAGFFTLVVYFDIYDFSGIREIGVYEPESAVDALSFERTACNLLDFDYACFNPEVVYPVTERRF